jgi:glycosyltransferase involved in cell wall biosynthesis
VVRGKGIVVRPGSAEDLASAIRSLIDNKELREHLGVAARQYAVDNLGLQKVLSQFEIDLASTQTG